MTNKYITLDTIITTIAERVRKEREERNTTHPLTDAMEWKERERGFVDTCSLLCDSVLLPADDAQSNGWKGMKPQQITN